MSIDVFELARLNGVTEGQVPLEAAVRLQADLRSVSGAIEYRLEGRIDASGRPAARLSLRADLPLTCDRCGQLLTFHLEHQGSFYFVREESELAALPITTEDEAEPLLGSTSFDVAALVEEEAILSLPISPRHAECTPPADEAGSAGAENPFAVLSGLLQKRRR
jgi:uncharacterized protein